MMQNKGQHLTVEQMFLFAMGLLITISIFLGFRAISDNVTDLVEEDRLNEIGTLVLSGVQNVVKELPENEEAVLVLAIPKEISRREYIIEAVGNNILVTVPEENMVVTLPMEGIEKAYFVTGRVSSSTGELRISGSRAGRVVRLSR